MIARRMVLCFLSLGVLVSGPLCFAQSRKLTGQVLAYDPLVHLAKMPSFVENTEILILETHDKKHRPQYMKLIVHSFGTEQLQEAYLSGNAPLTLRATRDRSCDQDLVELETAETPIPLNDGRETHDIRIRKFVVSEHFKTEPLPQLSHLDCYSAKGEEHPARRLP